jgi:GTPase SAR1 family protein
MEEVNSNGNEAMEVLLIGNKTDLQNERQVSYEEGKAFADKQKLKFLEITATDYKKVETAFNTLAESILAKIDKGEIS